MVQYWARNRPRTSYGTYVTKGQEEGEWGMFFGIENIFAELAAMLTSIFAQLAVILEQFLGIFS